MSRLDTEEVSRAHPQGTSIHTHGDADIAAIATLFADPGRARILAALADGRALPASVLAGEAGIAASSASAHLRRLVDGGLLEVRPSGRHRYYRLSGPEAADVLEALAAAAPPLPVRSLRQGTRAAALRRARTCYDHLAGRLGVRLTQVLLDRGALQRVDGLRSVDRSDGDPYAAPLRNAPYRLGGEARRVLADFGVDLDRLDPAANGSSRRPLLRFCVDWSEQRHHVAGRVGAALLEALLSDGSVERRPQERAVRLTDRGRDRLSALDIDVELDDVG